MRRKDEGRGDEEGNKRGKKRKREGLARGIEEKGGRKKR